MGITRFPHGLNIRQSMAKGATAGTITITGIAVADHLRAVWSVRFLTTGLINSVADLTAEFSISAANTVTNAAGTNTTGRLLLVTWFDADA